MNELLNKLRQSPVLARVIPFAIFVGLTFLQGTLGTASHFGFYLVKTLAGAALVWAVWPAVTEMRWKFSWEAVVVGVLVFAVWVGLDPFYPKWEERQEVWNPFREFGAGTALAWFFIGVRILGSALVVPMIEEVFYRSFLYRYIIDPDFLKVSLGRFHWTAFALAAIFFGVAHLNEWLAAIACACAYQGLVLWKGRLGDAMTAHAITNALLGIWVVWKGAWQFW